MPPLFSLHLLRLAVNRFTMEDLAPNSRRSYASNVRGFYRFCASHSLTPFPITRSTLSLYAAHWMLKGNKYSSFKGIRSSLKYQSFLLGHPWLDATDLEWMKKLCKGINRTIHHTPRRAAPLTVDILFRMAAIADFSQLSHVQFLTMAFVAHDGLLRANELFELRLSDVTFHDDDSISLRIRRSKANQSGPAETVILVPSDALCGASTLQALWRRQDLSSIRRRYPNRRLFPVFKQAWVDYLRSLLTQLGLPAQDFTGHSFRSGGATDLWAADTPPRLIQLHGRWASDSFWLYIRHNPHLNAQAVAAAFRRLIQAQSA